MDIGLSFEKEHQYHIQTPYMLKLYICEYIESMMTKYSAPLLYTARQ